MVFSPRGWPLSHVVHADINTVIFVLPCGVFELWAFCNLDVYRSMFSWSICVCENECFGSINLLIMRMCYHNMKRGRVEANLVVFIKYLYSKNVDI